MSKILILNGSPRKNGKTASLMYELSQAFYDIFPHYLGWENLGEILGAGKEEEAKQLGASIR